MPDNNSFIPNFDDVIQEAADFMASHSEDPPSSREAKDAIETITIKFGKGLVGEPFTSKNGKELVEIRIPNSDPNDKRPWQTFVLDARSVHDNKYGKGMWAKIPAEGHTTVQRSVMTVTSDGKKQWDREKRTISNKELKSMIEFYKIKSRESITIE